MTSGLRKAIVGALAMGFVVLLAFGHDLLGSGSGVGIMIGAFVLGFAWLWLLVAPWAIEGRTRPRR